MNPKPCINFSVSLSRKEESNDGQKKFEINNKKKISSELSNIGDKKKSKNNKTNNLENTIQRLLEQQEARHMESDRRSYFK